MWRWRVHLDSTQHKHEELTIHNCMNECINGRDKQRSSPEVGVGPAAGVHRSWMSRDTCVGCKHLLETADGKKSFLQMSPEGGAALRIL